MVRMMNGSKVQAAGCIERGRRCHVQLLGECPVLHVVSPMVFAWNETVKDVMPPLPAPVLVLAVNHLRFRPGPCSCAHRCGRPGCAALPASGTGW